MPTPTDQQRAEVIRSMLVSLLEEVSKEPLPATDFMRTVAELGIISYADALRLDGLALVDFAQSVFVGALNHIQTSGYIEDAVVAAALDRPDVIPPAAAFSVLRAQRDEREREQRDR